MQLATDMAEAAPTTTGDFAGLVRQHQAMVFSIAFHFLHDRSLAEEIAQEVFLQLHQHQAELEPGAHMTFWLRRVTSNRCIDWVRRRKLRPQVSLEDVPEPATQPAASDPLLSQALRKLVASLPEKPRMVVILRYQEDMDPREIAESLGMPVRTVKSHLQRSLAMLREKLGRTVGEENV
jgi:RNA polymerase sigma-70 factor (ECF subfamily)